MWVEPDTRDEVVDHVRFLLQETALSLKQLLRLVGISKSKFHSWAKRRGEANHHNGTTPKEHWLLPWEEAAILDYYRKHPEEGYRRLTYMMMDADVVAVSPSSTYRVLSKAGCLKRWNTNGKSLKRTGFVQPEKPHEHWHTDIKYVNFHGTFLFLITVIDGFSRSIVHHELRLTMTEADVALTIERALEKHSGVTPRIISDNGKQFIAKDLNDYLREKGLTHWTTSLYYPQSNGKIERYHRTLSEECLRKDSFIDLDDAREQITRFVEYYNTKRLHSAIFFLTPEEVMAGRMQERLGERQAKLDRAQEARREAHRAA
jgi:putative transposase